MGLDVDYTVRLLAEEAREREEKKRKEGEYRHTHDDHYRQLGVQPREMLDAIWSAWTLADKDERPPAAARDLMNRAIEYCSRAGTKSNEHWKKDAQKSINCLHRAIHGVWPWEQEHKEE